MPSEYAVPSRVALIQGAIHVALYGLLQELKLEARHLGLDHNGPAQAGEYTRTKLVLDALRGGQLVQTDEVRILQLLAHTQQVLRVSHDEWETCVPIHHKVGIQGSSWSPRVPSLSSEDQDALRFVAASGDFTLDKSADMYAGVQPVRPRKP